MGTGIIRKSKQKLKEYATDMSAITDESLKRKHGTNRKMNKMRREGYLLVIVIIFTAIFSCSKKIVPAEISKGKAKVYDSAAFEHIFVEAIKQKLLGNSGDALKYLEQCTRINPESDGSYYQIAQILQAGGDSKKATRYILKAYNIDENNIWYLMMLAGTYYQQGNLDSAIYFYEKATERYPDRDNLKVTLGSLYSETKRYERASSIFEELNDKYGVNETSTLAAIRNYMNAGQYDKAQAEALDLIEEFPDNLMYSGLLAEIYSEKGENEKATEVYNRLMKSNPENPATQLSLCDFLLKQKEYEELLSLLNIVAMNSTISPEMKIQLFSGLMEDVELIKKFGDKLLLPVMVMEEVDKNDRMIKLIRPDLLTKLGRYGDAAGRLEEIITTDPENYYAWEKLLLVYFDSGNFRKLQERGEECATKFNRSFLVKLLYATGASENKDYATAIEELQKANILAGNDKDALMQVLSIKADVYYKMKDYEQAFKTFEEAVKTDNSDITILNNFAYYLAEQGLRLKEAENMAEQVISREPDNNTFLDTYGWILFKRGKIREAQKVFIRIIGSNERPDAEYFEHYGYILKKKRNCKEAVEYWKKALELDETKTELLKEIQKCGD